ncbi:hypothetical protein MTO96_041989 [Rhipicephalus appendiculatus]
MQEPVPAPPVVAEGGGLLSAWAEAAVFAAELLGQIPARGAGESDHADAFLYELASRTRTAEALDLVYKRHPRLRTFLVSLLLAGVSLLAVAAPVTIVACITSGSVPFARRATAPQHCLACCVLLGLLAMFAFGDLVTMLAFHVAVTDATPRVPSALAKTAAYLRRYVNRTVVELLVELNDVDYDVARSISSFLYGIISEDALVRITSISCLVALANHSFVSKLRNCRNVSAQMLMPGAQLPKVADIIGENLHLQLNHTLEGLDELESRLYGFEQRTRLWGSSAIIDQVGLPMAMVLLGLIVGVLGCGIGLGIRSCVNLSGRPLETYRYIGVIFLANAVLVMLFHVLATAILTTTVTTGVLADCYVCLPYRRMRFVYLDRLTQMIWPHSDRGLLFALLTPQVVLTKCAGEGASIAELRVVKEMTNPYLTISTQRSATKRWLVDSKTQGVQRNPTAGNCRGVYDVVRRAMSTFCDKFLKNHLGLTLSLAIGVILSAVILPLTLVVSQYFMTPPNDTPARLGRKPGPCDSKRREISREEFFANSSDISSSAAMARTASHKASKVKRLPRRRGGKCLSKQRCPREMDQMYKEEGDAIKRISTSSSSKGIITYTTASTSPLDNIERVRETTGFRKKSFLPWPTAIPWVTVHHPQISAIGCENDAVVCNVHAITTDRNVNPQGFAEYRTCRGSPLTTPDGEQEPSLGNEVPLLAAMPLGSDVRYQSGCVSEPNCRSDAAICESELQCPLTREPARVSWPDFRGIVGCTHGMLMTYPPSCPPIYDIHCPCGSADVHYHDQ